MIDFDFFLFNNSESSQQDIPVFDNNGLWFYQGIGFSQKRDLTNTIRHLIDNSTPF